MFSLICQNCGFLLGFQARRQAFIGASGVDQASGGGVDRLAGEVGLSRVLGNSHVRGMRATASDYPTIRSGRERLAVQTAHYHLYCRSRAVEVEISRFS